MFHHRLGAALLLPLGLGGCAIVTSQPDAPGAPREGSSYMLPKALLPIELVEADGVLMLRMQAPVMVGDPSQRYIAAHRRNPFSSDELKVEIDPATGLLASVTATGTDVTLDVLKELALLKSARSAELGSGETVLFSGTYDPDGDWTVPAADGGRKAVDQSAVARNADLLASMKGAMAHRLKQWQGACSGDKSADKQTCADAGAMLQGLSGEKALVVRALPLKAADSAPASADTTAQEASACAVGICYRTLQPFQVTLAIENVFAQTIVLQLPNQGAPVGVPLDRAPFVKTEHTVLLDHGQLKSVETKRPSSALALVSWPLDVYRSVLTATAELVQLRIGANKAEVDMAQSNLDTAKALKDIDEQLAKLSAGPELGTNAAALAGPSRRGTLMAMELGQRKARPVSDLLPNDKTPPQEAPAPVAAPRPGLPFVPVQPASAVAPGRH